VPVGAVTAVADPAQLPLAVDLAREAARPVDWPGLGLRAPDSLRLIVVRDGAVLDSLTGGRIPEWGAAVALPGARTIAIRADGTDLRRILRHELAHLALHQDVPVRVPLWFDEGFAGYAAGEWDRYVGLEVNLAVARGSLPDLRGLDGALRSSSGTAEAAYALAMSAVAELARRNPSGTLEPLLERLRTGEEFDSAVLATTGLAPDRFEEAWQRATRRRYGLATWLLAGGGWLVVAAIVLGSVRFRRRADQARRAALDEGWEIAPEALDGSELDPARRE
jgi:peptidase MA superfamily protein